MVHREKRKIFMHLLRRSNKVVVSALIIAENLSYNTDGSGRNTA